MSYQVGDLISFWSHDQEFDHVDTNKIDYFLKEGVQWYKVKEIGGTNALTVQAESGGRDIPLTTSGLREYKIYTKESLTKLLEVLHNKNEADKQYADVCKKIRQLYNKQHFKFAT